METHDSKAGGVGLELAAKGDLVKNQEADNPIFMFGMPRSGSTVISEAFSMHEDLGFISNYVHRLPMFPQLSILNRVSFIPSIGWFMRGKKKQDSRIAAALRRLLPYPGDNYTLWRYLCGEKMLWEYLDHETAGPEVRSRVREYAQRLLRHQGRPRLYEKLNGPPRMVYLSSIFPNASFIHVIRDPRAVVASMKKFKPWISGGGLERPWWNPLPAEDLRVWEEHGKTASAIAAIQWRRVVEMTWREHETLNSSRFAEVRYEDFVNRPHETISRIFREMGLSECGDAHRYIDSVSAPRNMNFKFRKQLDRDEIDSIERITAVPAEKAGYRFGSNPI